MTNRSNHEVREILFFATPCSGLKYQEVLNMNPAKSEQGQDCMSVLSCGPGKDENWVLGYRESYTNL
ncbi:uncharacterized protein METZ01_LOCUS234152 [marine metagenome]|uniref:Uncharacterized protein n=1 Tax=marine metagenome TaxID=408172 RepID=A0A382H1Y7_9ZZZZ